MPTANTFTLGLVQMHCEAEPDVNVDKAVSAIHKAAESEAQIVCLPELFRTPYFCQRQSPEQRLVALQLLAKEVSGCTRCKELASTRTQTVFGVGPPDAELCFIGEAPGRDEDLQGEPFVGPAGQLLNRIIAAAGLKRQDVYICNVLRCRPPGNRPPKVEEAESCREYLEKTLELLRPRYICTLGASAAKHLLQLNPATTMGKLRKRFHDYKGIPVLCTYHPSYLLRLEEPEKTEKKREVWEDMKLLLNRMGKPIPAKG